MINGPAYENLVFITNAQKPPLSVHADISIEAK